MQKSLTLLSFLFSLLAFSANGQLVSLADDGAFATHDPAEIVAPAVNAPIYLDDNGTIRIGWEEIGPQLGYSVEYELKIFQYAHLSSENEIVEKEEPVFSTVTSSTHYVYGEADPALSVGKEYVAVVNAHLVFDDRTEVVDGVGNAIRFEYIPECTAPKSVRVTSIGSDNFEVDWKGPEATEDGVNYIVLYKPMESAVWTEVLIEEGRSIQLERLNNQFTYEVEVKKLCPSIDNEPELSSVWVGMQDISLPSSRSITLPFDCNDPSFTMPQCTGASETQTTFDTLYTGGFPVLVDTMWIQDVPGGSGKKDWYGWGWIPLPFGDSLVVKVEWGGDLDNLITIDDDGVLCTGIMKGISDDPMYWPDLNPGPIPFGGQICLPPPSEPGFDTSGIHSATGLPWDENGFGPNGTYDQQPPYPGYAPGDLIDTTGMYDPWGFDANGNHFSGDGTGTVNEYGCTQEQLNSQPQEAPCDSLPPPYYWLGGNGSGNGTPTQEGNELANQAADSLSAWIAQILTGLEEEYQDSIDAQSTDCDGIRTSMNTLVAALGYPVGDRKLLFGPNDEYFDEGMSGHFTTVPEPLSVNIERDPNQEQLEEKHIELYYCDNGLQVYKLIKDILSDMKANQLNELVTDLTQEIESFTAAEAELYSLPDGLLEWLEWRLKLISNENYDDLYGFLETPLKFEEEPGQPGFNGEGWASSNIDPDDIFSNMGLGNHLAVNVSEGELNQVFLESMEFTLEDASFQFKQGWKEINGVHRAHWLEAIEKGRKSPSLSPPHFFTAHDNTLMPIVVGNRGSDGRLYQVYLDDITFYTNYASLDAYILLEMPNNGQKIVFEADDIEFTPIGPHLSGGFKLNLATDIEIRLSNAAKLTINGSDSTYVKVDCNGYAGIGLDLDVEICRDYVIPIDPETLQILPDPADRVHGHIQTFFPTLNDFYAEISMDPFVINGLEDIKWRIDMVAVDFSDIQSPGAPAAPPSGYVSEFASAGGGFQPCWQGFYMSNFSANLPKQFSETADSITVGVDDVVIDDLGLSGRIYAADGILPLSEGNAGGWAFSIDTVSITVVTNQLQDASISGLINVPLISNANDCNTGPATANDCLSYRAFIEPGNIYHFDVTMPDSNYCIDMWKAGSVVLNSNTKVQMRYENGDFEMLAKLFGEVSINGNVSNSIGLNIGNIRFENVELSNKAPHFSPGVWKFPTTFGANFGGFGITISDLKMVKTDEGEPALNFGAQIQIVNDEIPISAGGGFQIIGEKVEPDGRQRWKFKDFKVKKIFLDGGFSGVARIQGLLEFFDDDPTYGTGFRGGVGATFEGLEASVAAIAHFGKKDDYKYFFVDALGCVRIPIVPGVDITGFGGGVYYHMNRTVGGGGAYGLPVCTGGVAIIPTTLGTSLSGINYSPDPTRLLGLKATVALAVVKETALSANATYEVLFKETSSTLGFGLDRIDFYGNARFMSTPDQQASPEASSDPDSPPSISDPDVDLKANIKFQLNFTNRTFSGDMVSFLEMPGGLLSGSGPDGRLSQTEVYFGPDKWYVRMGRPPSDLRNGMILKVPGMNEPLAEIGSYFQIGNGGIDDLPDIPNVMYTDYGLDNDFHVTNPGGFTNTGSGFIFGAQLTAGFDRNVEVAGIKLARAYANGILGFDIGVLDWGSSATCASWSSGENLGINGWYAQGQLYGGFNAGIEIAGANVANVSFAGAMQARFPNPFWAKGQMKASIEHLGKTRSVTLNAEFGEKCEIVGVDNPVVETPVIERIVPANGMTGVGIEANPTINFLMPIGESFGLPELGSGIEYKPELDHARILWRGDTIVLDGYEWNEEMTELILIPRHYLPSNDTFVMDVLVHVDSNNIVINEEHRLDTFYTGFRSNKIFEANVAGSYPFDGQFNFYKDEIPNQIGYILFDKGQPELFYDMEDYDEMKIRWKESATGETIALQPVSYLAVEGKVKFFIPADQMDNEKLYTVELVRIPKPDDSFGNPLGGTNEPTGNIQNQAGFTDPFGNGKQDITQYPIPTTPPAGTQSNDPPPPPVNSQVGANNSEIDSTLLDDGYSTSASNEIIVYQMHFRTSRYNTFMEKAAVWAANKTVTPSPVPWFFSSTGGGGGTGNFGNRIPEVSSYSDQWGRFANETTMEPFDKYEVLGYKGGEPLVKIEMDPSNFTQPNGNFSELSTFMSGYYDSPNFYISPVHSSMVAGHAILQDLPDGPNDLWVRPDWGQSGVIPQWAQDDYRVLFINQTGWATWWDYMDYRGDCIQHADEVKAQFCGTECDNLDYCPVLQALVDDNHLSDSVRKIICTDVFPVSPEGNYDVIIKYTLPSEESPRSLYTSDVELQY